MKNPYETLGKTHVTWLICVGLGGTAFFIHPNSTNLPSLFMFLGAAGGFTTWRSVAEDKKEIAK